MVQPPPPGSTQRATLGRVDRYELLDLLGHGSFGGVYRARHAHTGQLVALKIARGGLDPDAAARILAEGRAAASLKHPNVVGIFDSGLTERGEAFVVMELLEGQTLAQLLSREGPLPVGRAVAIATQILDGLAAAHARGIVHRDLKPANVFVAQTESGADLVKVIDFGISKLRAADVTGAGALTLPGVAMGTPGYMAPEQLGDARSVDVRADVYSVGATLYEMLSRTKPVQVDSFEGWMRRLVEEPARSLAAVAPHVPPAVAAVVDRALARDRDARWPSAAAMKSALEQALVARASAPPPDVTMRDAPLAPLVALPRTAPPPPPGPSAWPWILAGVASLLAVLSVVAAVLVVVARRNEQPAPTGARPPASAVAAAPPEPDERPDPAREEGETPEPSASAAPAPPSRTAPASGGSRPAPPPAPASGVTVRPPRPVGDLDVSAFMALADRARPRLELCNGERKAQTVAVDVMIGMGKITIAQPSVARSHGDVRVARCAADALKKAEWPGFRPGDSGIYQAAEITWR